MAQVKRKERLKTVDAAEGATAPEGGVPAVPGLGPTSGPWHKPEGLSRRGWMVLGAILFLFELPLIHYFLLRPEPAATVSLPFTDEFSDPSTVRRNYWANGGQWRVLNGMLSSPGVKNNPLWLKAK